MKEMPLALFTLVFFTSMSFAEDTSVQAGANNSANLAQTFSNAGTLTQVSGAPVTPTQLPDSTNPSNPARATTFTGKFDSVSSGDSMSGPHQQITVKDNNGQGMTFMVTSDTAIIGKTGDSTTLDWIDKDDAVSIEYIANKDGTKTAKSIKVSAGW